MSTAGIVDYVNAHRAEHGVEPSEDLTEVGTQIAPSIYYAAKTRAPSARRISDATTDLLRFHAENYGVYGVSARCTPSCNARPTRWLGGPWRV